jgi:hypothetical protein
MVVKDEHDRILMTHEAASENGEDAKKFLQHVKDLGLTVTAAFSDYSQSFTGAFPFFRSTCETRGESDLKTQRS